MSFIEMPIGDAVEKSVLPEGDYDLVIQSADFIEAQGGKAPRISVRLEAEGEPDAKAIFHSISLPGKNDDSEKVNNKLLFAKAFLDAFSIPYDENGFELEDMYGCRGRVHVVQEEYQGNINNRIKLTF